MGGANSSRSVGDEQTRCDPIQVGIGRQQGVKLVNLVVILCPVWLHQQFCHRDRRRYCGMLGSFQPRENMICQMDVPGIYFQLIDENAGIQGNSLMTAQKVAEARQSQLWRSFLR